MKRALRIFDALTPLMFRAAVLLMLSLSQLACETPFGVFSGGELSGTLAEAPPTWQFAEDSALAQLETRPEAPYSINLVYVQLNDRLYVYAGNTRTKWVTHIDENPSVRIQIDATIYPTRAVRVNDADELRAFAVQWSSRSLFQRDPMQFDEVWLYRLEAR